MKYKKGEVWETNSRKGALTVRLLENVDSSKDGFFLARIIHGKAQYMSEMNNELQEQTGLGTQGTNLSMRTTLTKFIKQVKTREAL